jgi:hypothetical protein
MQIIGAGFGRTGTLSLKTALEQLGFAPCYHMTEVLMRPSHIAKWQAAADGQSVDWVSFLGGYKAALDYPQAHFYKEMMAGFPEAKVILTVRDADRWYESTLETIYQGSALPAWLTRLLPPYRGFERMVRETVWQRIFHGRFEDRQYAISVFNAHIAEVKATVPPDKLLVFDVKQGWEPLCTFLGVPVPPRPFPHVNERRLMKGALLLGKLLPVGFLLVILAWLTVILLS